MLNSVIFMLKSRTRDVRFVNGYLRGFRWFRCFNTSGQFMLLKPGEAPACCVTWLESRLGRISRTASINSEKDVT